MLHPKLRLPFFYNMSFISVPFILSSSSKPVLVFLAFIIRGHFCITSMSSVFLHTKKRKKKIDSWKADWRGSSRILSELKAYCWKKRDECSVNAMENLYTFRAAENTECSHMYSVFCLHPHLTVCSRKYRTFTRVQRILLASTLNSVQQKIQNVHTWTVYSACMHTLNSVHHTKIQVCDTAHVCVWTCMWSSIVAPPPPFLLPLSAFIININFWQEQH